MAKRRRQRKPLAARTQRERYKAENILGGAPTSPSKIYDPDVHPREMLEFFRGRYAEAVDAERNENERGDLKYVGVPVRVPTFAGFAAQVGVARETIWAWKKKYTEFAEAGGRCEAIQEAFLVEQGTIGALNLQMTIFSLKNLQGWSEKADVSMHGSVELHFDEQDEGA